MTFYIYKILKKFTKMDKKKQEIRSVCVFLKGRNWGVSVGWVGVSFGTDENVLELDIGRWHSDKESACQFLTYGRCGFDPWVGKIPWRRAWQPTPGFSPGKSQEQKSLEDPSSQYHKETDMTEHTRAHTHTHTHTFSGFQCLAWGKE